MVSRWMCLTNTIHTIYIYTGTSSLWTKYFSEWNISCCSGPLLNSNWLREPLYWQFNRGAILSSTMGCERKRWILKGRGKDNAGDRGWLKADRTTQWRGNRQLTSLQPSEQRERVIDPEVGSISISKKEKKINRKTVKWLEKQTSLPETNEYCGLLLAFDFFKKKDWDIYIKNPNLGKYKGSNSNPG